MFSSRDHQMEMLFWALLLHGSRFLTAAPSVSVSSPIHRANLGGDILLGCTFTRVSPSHPSRPSILWYHYYDDEVRLVHHRRGSQEDNGSVKPQDPSYRGRTLIQHGQVRHGNASLLLSAVRLGDVGLYRCIVTESGGMEYAESVLEVYTPYQNGRILLSRWKETVLGACEFSRGYPQALLEWHYPDGGPIVAETTDEVTKDSNGLFNLRGTLQFFERSRVTLCCSWRNSFSQRNSTLCQTVEDVWLSQKRYPGTWAIIILLLFLAFCIGFHSCCQSGTKGKKKRSPLGWRCLDPKTEEEEEEIQSLLWCHSNGRGTRKCPSEALKITQHGFGARAEIVLLGLPLHGEELLFHLHCQVIPEGLPLTAVPAGSPLHTLELRNGISISVEPDFQFTIGYLAYLEARYKKFCRTRAVARMRFAFVYSCAEKLDVQMKWDISSVFHFMHSLTGCYPAVVLVSAREGLVSEPVSFFSSFDAGRLLIIQAQKEGGGDERETFRRFLDVCLSGRPTCGGRTSGWRTQNETAL
ncbi:butyrophilin subfamily 2 member A1-like [Ambystoma mexicanum]|uniref:butyrophilin subfamily 2 member A1-like n=1 Tax=Ambystoma mexicanum TaxID=8296 RepID=UPI0037E8D58D